MEKGTFLSLQSVTESRNELSESKVGLAVGRLLENFEKVTDRYCEKAALVWASADYDSATDAGEELNRLTDFYNKVLPLGGLP